MGNSNTPTMVCKTCIRWMQGPLRLEQAPTRPWSEIIIITPTTLRIWPWFRDARLHHLRSLTVRRPPKEVSYLTQVRSMQMQQQVELNQEAIMSKVNSTWLVRRVTHLSLSKCNQFTIKEVMVRVEARPLLTSTWPRLNSRLVLTHRSVLARFQLIVGAKWRCRRICNREAVELLDNWAHRVAPTVKAGSNLYETAAVASKIWTIQLCLWVKVPRMHSGSSTSTSLGAVLISKCWLMEPRRRRSADRSN